jgi:hypothetical protein
MASPAHTILVSDPVGSHDHIFILSKTTHVFRKGASSSTGEGVGPTVTLSRAVVC